MVCGDRSDCPSTLLNAGGTVGSVILTMPDHRRWVANVNTGRTPVGDAAPVVVVLGWHPTE